MPGYKIETRGIYHRMLTNDIRREILEGCEQHDFIGEDLASYTLQKQEEWIKTRAMLSLITNAIWKPLRRDQNLEKNAEIPDSWRPYDEKMTKMLDKLYVKKMQERIMQSQPEETAKRR